MRALKGRKRATLTCDAEGCTATVTVDCASPAAVELTACERAHKDHGWGYSMGFQAMIFGHRVLCPTCARPSERQEG